MLRKMGRGDWIIFYSPKTAYPDGEPLQAEMTPDFYPWRRNVDFIEGKARWGYKFRFGGAPQAAEPGCISSSRSGSGRWQSLRACARESPNNVVPAGPEGGDALVRHPGVRKIHFTGGTTTARRVIQAAAQNLTPVVAELGGKSANIVFEDADLDSAAERAAFQGPLVQSGQRHENRWRARGRVLPQTNCVR
jgi:hypothetical protein